jgi:site-specific DNA-methyltransferase (adenine-specific)
VIFILEINKIYNDDCVGTNGMCLLSDESIDMILCDLPYGTTACKWDTIIPFELLWEQYERIIKNNGAIVLFGQEPFSSNLRMSNIKNYKYDWVWDKKIPSGMSYARFQPMRRVENIMVFTKNGEKTAYNPQLELRDKPIKKGGNQYSPSAPIQAAKEGKTFKKTYTHKQPTNLLKFDKIRRGSVHPTQKPVELFEYLIKTYTDENDIVLDNCMGSGTTAIAAINTNRNYIGFELDENYFNIANERIKNHLAE